MALARFFGSEVNLLLKFIPVYVSSATENVRRCNSNLVYSIRKALARRRRVCFSRNWKTHSTLYRGFSFFLNLGESIEQHPIVYIDTVYSQRQR